MRRSGLDAPRKRVLVLEDDAAIGELIRVVLMDEGFEAALARDGGEALEFVRERPPELMLADIHLAGSEPVEEIIRAIRAHTGPELPVLAMSASSEHERCHALGAYGFVDKRST